MHLRLQSACLFCLFVNRRVFFISALLFLSIYITVSSLFSLCLVMICVRSSLLCPWVCLTVALLSVSLTSYSHLLVCCRVSLAKVIVSITQYNKAFVVCLSFVLFVCMFLFHIIFAKDFLEPLFIKAYLI